MIIIEYDNPLSLDMGWCPLQYLNICTSIYMIVGTIWVLKRDLAERDISTN